MSPIAKCVCGRSKYLSRDNLHCFDCGEALERVASDFVGLGSLGNLYAAQQVMAQRFAQRSGFWDGIIQGAYSAGAALHRSRY